MSLNLARNGQTINKTQNPCKFLLTLGRHRSLKWPFAEIRAPQQMRKYLKYKTILRALMRKSLIGNLINWQVPNIMISSQLTHSSAASVSLKCRKCHMLVPQVPHVSATVPHLRNEVGSLIVSFAYCFQGFLRNMRVVR